jgi:hypothetical protein
MSTENDGGMILTGESRRTRKETCPSATLSTTIPTWNDPAARTRDSAVRDRRLAASGMARPKVNSLLLSYLNNSQTRHMMCPKVVKIILMIFHFQLEIYLYFLSIQCPIRTDVQSANKNIDFLT